MRRRHLLLIVVLTVATFLCAGLQVEAAQETPSSERLNVKAKELSQYAQDLLSLAKATRTEPLESEIALNLTSSAMECYEYLSAASDLFSMYEVMSSQAERSAVKPIINERLDHSAKQIENAVNAVNAGLGNTKRPGVAETGTRLREAMREAVALLRSVRLK